MHTHPENGDRHNSQVFLRWIKNLFENLNKKLLSIPAFAKIILGVVCLIVCSFFAGYWLPGGIDWTNTYRPAALAFLSGKSPFSVDIFFAAPWAVIPLIPFAILPDWLGRGFIFVLGMLVFAITAKQLGAKPVALVAFLLSPPVWHCLLNSNIEWLPLLGYILPPQIGLFFVVVKPQIGIGAAIFWLFLSWREGGIKKVIRVFSPVLIVTLLSFMLYGLWPLRFQNTLTMTRDYNQSFWPLSIPVGLGLMVYAFRRREIRPAMAASPCLSPYVLLHAWVGALAAVVTDDLVTVAAVLGLWIAMGIRALGQ